MQYSLAILALAVVGKANPVAFPQAVTAAISPPEPAPSGCLPTVAGSFGIAVHDVAKPTGVAKRQAASESNE